MRGKVRILGWITVTAVAVAVVVFVVKSSLTGPSFSQEEEPPRVEGPPGRLVVVPGEGGVLEEGRAVYNFGVMAAGREGSHTFVLRNEGEGSLVLQAGEHSCYCTGFAIAEEGREPVEFAQGQQRVLAPGEELALELRWHVRDALHREFRHGADLHIVNDPATATIRFSAEGETYELATVQPGTLTVQGATTNETVERELLYVSSADESLRITGVETSRDEITAQCEPLSAEALEQENVRAGYRVRVTLHPGLAIGRHQEWIELHAEASGDSLRRTVDVNVVVEGPVTIRGTGFNAELNQIVIGTVPRGRGAQREFTMWVRGGQREDAQWEVLETRPDYLRATVEARNVGAGSPATPYALTLELPPDAPPSTFMGPDPERVGMVRLGSNIPGAEELQVQVRFAVGS